MTTDQAILSPAAQAMLDKIRSYGHVSFVELETAAASTGLETSGDMCITLGEDYPNVIQWMNLSQSFLDALQEIMKLIDPSPCSWYVYLIDGRLPRMPICKARSLTTARNYSKPHWLPVTFQPKATEP